VKGTGPIGRLICAKTAMRAAPIAGIA